MPFWYAYFLFVPCRGALSGYALLLACRVSACDAWLLTAVCGYGKVKNFFI